LFKPNVHRKGAKSAEELGLSAFRSLSEKQKEITLCVLSGSAVSVILERFYGHYWKFSPIYRGNVNAQETSDQFVLMLGDPTHAVFSA
jgi:hypothetical protein